MKQGLVEILERLGGERRIHYALENIKSALAEVGSPHENVQTIVIAGTNGKGTTTLLVSNALRCAGYNVATFLSPHLQSVNERFLLNMQPAEMADLNALAEKYASVADSYDLSYFELLTFLFFVWAKEHKAETLVLEVGLGGRLDATNVTKPLACAVTSIDFDHMSYLGNSLEEILMEKLGVVPKEGTLVSGVTQNDLREKTALWAGKESVSLFEAQSVKSEKIRVDWSSQVFSLNGIAFSLNNPNPKMVDNAKTAFLLLQKAFPKIPLAVIQEAFATCRFPGRFETVAENPKIILSGDHNPAGLDSLFATLELLPEVPLHILCGFSPDKPYAEMYARLKKCAKRIALVPLTNARGKYRDDYRKLGTPFFETAEEGLRWVLSDCPKEEICLVTGSLYLVGQVGPGFRRALSFTA